MSEQSFLALTRRALVAFALVCLLAPGEAAASAAHATTTNAALATTVVSGPAGSKVYLSIDRTVQMNPVGLDSTVSASTGRWEGMLVERADHGYRYASRDYYIRYDLTQAELCPGRRCPFGPFSQGVFGGHWHNTGRRSGTLRNPPVTFELPAGRYAVVLLGDPGARVAATLQLHGLPDGVLQLAAHERARLEATFIRPNVTVKGNDVVSRDYKWYPGGAARFDGLAVGYALSQPAAANFSWCSTFGPPASQLCLGGGDVTGGSPLVLTHVGSYAYGVGYGLAWSRKGLGSGMGYDAEAVAASSRLVALYFSASAS